MAEQAALPPDIHAIGNSRLLISQTGSAFLVDAGYDKLLPELRRLQAAGSFQKLEGIWITHYHDDHTDFVNDVTAAFPAPVYFTQAMTKVLAKPDAFRLPCLTTRSIATDHARNDGDTLHWHEWDLTFLKFPGQTLYHGGLLAKRDDGKTIFFVGDSFTPSGLDDYCMQNRNFLRSDAGYAYCLRKIAALPDAWLVNQHVAPMFRFDSAQLARMQQELSKRSAVLQELSPWPDINYMLDESWARVFPYAQVIDPGAAARLELRLTNHAPTAMRYRIHWNIPTGWQLESSQDSVTIPAHQDAAVAITVKPIGNGLGIVTADLDFGSQTLKSWTEGLVRVR